MKIITGEIREHAALVVFLNKRLTPLRHVQYNGSLMAQYETQDAVEIIEDLIANNQTSHIKCNIPQWTKHLKILKDLESK